jgi:hypothetical protein
MKYIEWLEPYDKEGTPVICRMKYEDVAKVQRAKDKRYVSDEQAVDDFIVIHWAQIKEYRE